MTTVGVVLFLIAHGLVHLIVYAPKPTPDEPAPFDPGHSWLLDDLGIGTAPQRTIGTVLAWVATVVYVITGVAVAVTGAWVPALAVAAAAAGVLLKLGWFNRWLLFGLALDLLVAGAALTAWPPSLAPS